MAELTTRSGATIKLKDFEAQVLEAFLKMIQGPQPWINTFMSEFSGACANIARCTDAGKDDGPEPLLSAACEALRASGDDAGGVLYQAKGRQYVRLDEYEAKEMMNYYGLIAAEHWLADLVSPSASLFAEDGKVRPPMDLRIHLEQCIETFETDVEIARRTMKHFPELFAAPAGARQGETTAQ